MPESSAAFLYKNVSTSITPSHEIGVKAAGDCIPRITVPLENIFHREREKPAFTCEACHRQIFREFRKQMNISRAYTRHESSHAIGCGLSLLAAVSRSVQRCPMPPHCMRVGEASEPDSRFGQPSPNFSHGHASSES